MSSHKTIAKNSFYLYFRMLITLAAGLYTSRLVLEALGVIDYGIYGLVGGIITILGFLSDAMSAAIQRYFSYDIGKGDKEQLQKTFNASVNIHFLIGFVIVLLAETVGLWFVNNKLDIPADRLVAANWVFQFSVFTFFFYVIQVPYYALLIAREHMNVYAYVSIVEVLLKLTIAIIVIRAKQDRLILYSALVFIVSLIIRILYKLYCKKHFVESIYKFYYSKKLYVELLSFSGWNIFGNVWATIRIQGSNVLLNLFFGPIANAAYNLTNMVQGIMMQFVNNFQMAANPQIIKDYADNNIIDSANLIYKSVKFSFFAFLLITFPIIINVGYLLNLWLTTVPEYTVGFVKLALIYTIIESGTKPIVVGINATGKIKRFNIITGIIYALNLPIAWYCFKSGKTPYYLYFIFIASSAFIILLRVITMAKLMNLRLSEITIKMFSKVATVSFFVFILYSLVLYYSSETNSFLMFSIKSVVIIFVSLTFIWFIGLTKNEKNFILTFIKSLLRLH